MRRIALVLLAACWPVVLSAQPAGGQGSGAPMMQPRQVSGIPRPDSQDPAGRLTVRAVMGEFHPTDSRAPVGAAIHLIGYSDDGTVSQATQTVDDSERVVFDGLATGGRVVYYAVALFERDGVVDRLASQPISMPPRVGVRLLLSGEKIESNKPAVDDLVAQESLGTPGRAEVSVRVGGQAEGAVDEVELVEVGRPDVVVKAPLSPPTPSAQDVRGLSREPTMLPALEGVHVTVHRVLAKGTTPLPEIDVALRRDGDDDPIATGATSSEGAAAMAATGVAPGTVVYVEADVFGAKVRSKTFPWPTSGGVRIAFESAWQSGGLEARFRDVLAGGDKVYLARTTWQGRVYRSTPFQIPVDRGAAVGIVVYPGLIFSFHGGGEVDDEHFWFQTEMTLYNPGRQPYLPPTGQVSIPLPRGFARVDIDERMSSRVQASGDGVVFRGAIPPGPVSFVLTYALPVNEGRVTVDQPLPMGAYQSQIIIRKTPTLELIDATGEPARRDQSGDGSPTMTLAGVSVREVPDRAGRPLYVLSNLNIRANEKLVFEIRGLPVRPAWYRWIQLLVGILAVSILAWGAIHLAQRRDDDERIGSFDKRRDELLARLASLDGEERKSGVAEEIRAELRALYERDDADEHG